MVRVEGIELKPQEVHKIALLVLHATINIIRGYKVVEKAEGSTAKLKQ
jgi:aspartate carbamoyltransferase regulatory subunit